MKKIDFKTRMQWGFFKAALFGAAVGILIAPAAGEALGISGSGEENPIISMLESISFGPKYKVMLNDKVVALAKSPEEAETAYKAARLAYNADGIKILNVEMSCEQVNQETDADTVKDMRMLRKDRLSAAILDCLGDYERKGRELAYTMRIDDYTVTLNNMENLVSILEQAQGKYDTEDNFQVRLQPPASRNVTMYEVDVKKKEEAAPETNADQTAAGGEDATTQGETGTPEEGTSAQGEPTPETEAPAEGKAAPETEAPAEGEAAPETEAPAEGETAPETETPAEGEDAAQPPEQPADLAAQAANDGVKYVGFSDPIQVMETYVSKSQIKDKDTAFQEITAENEEQSIYVVQPGDSLSVIAENNDMTVEDIKMLNPHIESDDDIYYDDRLNITVPRAAVQILVEKQETYEEEYNADVVYEDDADMFIGESEVVQEGTPGKHTVTDLVTYTGDLESGREQLQETVQVAAVAQVVRRGTKSKPTYMYPVTNWNITSNFGYRWGRLHAGTEVGVPVGTTVRASRGGQVITAGWVGGYGNCVMIDHGDGVVTVYGHLSEVLVSVGQYVDQGEQIALSGNTGRSTGPHLHFEIRVNGQATDAMPYLTQSN